MSVLEQRDFGGGIWRELTAPPGHVYDAINAIVDGSDILRRGGTAVKSNADAFDTIIGVFGGLLIGGHRTVFWSPAEQFVLQADDVTPLSLGALYAVWGPPAVLNGVLYFPVLSLGKWRLLTYAGSRKPSYSTGTLTVSLGSKIVSGIGTSWLANLDVGMFLEASPGSGRTLGPIASVDSNTQVTLVDAAPANFSGVAYSATPMWLSDGNRNDGPGVELAAVAEAGGRLLWAYDNRVYESSGYQSVSNEIDFPIGSDTTIPEGSILLGLYPVGDSAFVFSTGGVFLLSNVAYDLTDPSGNPQQAMTQVSKDLILWGDMGLASWASQVVVPAVDDVYLLAPGAAPAAISRGIRGLYRSYVAAGYRPGQATVFNGHYLLPILSYPNVIVEVLVCRLDQRDGSGDLRPAWTRWSGHAAATAFARRIPVTAGSSPALIGATGHRLIDATGCLSPAAANKADGNGTAFPFDVTTNDFDTGPGNRNTVQRLRARYELVDAATDNPSIASSYVVGPVGTAAVALGTAGESDGLDPAAWRMVKRARHIRFRLLSSGAAATLRLRALELFVRQSNRP